MQHYVHLLPILLLAGICEGLTYYFGNGSHYEGDVDDLGRPSGDGQFFTNQGTLTYNGTFSAGQYNGTGQWFSNGHSYQGEFLDGVAAGLGSWLTPKGDVVTGEFSNHTVHGNATWWFSNAISRLEKMAGTFRNGLAHGEGIVIFKDGSRLESKFKKGYPHGVGKVTDDEGSLIWDGIIWNGKPMGNVSEDIENLFLDLNLNPLRLKYQET